jgi:uncharacterized repeat protein (TIGR01451 family)
MFSVHKQIRRVGLVAVALGSIGLSGQAFADGTLSDTVVSNTATVNYTVNSVAQTPIAAVNTFHVDTIIRVSVSGGLTINVTPGAVGQIATYVVTNTSNIASRFTLGVTNQAAPSNDFDMNNLVIHVDNNANGTYEPATDTPTSINTLAAGASITVFVTGDVPVATANNFDAPVQLLATAINPGNNLAWVTDTGLDNQNTAQVVVSIASANASDTFHTQTATLAVSKTSAVITDGLSVIPPNPNPKAIPGATLEYSITIANSGSSPATLQSISDPVPAQTAFLPGQYTGGRDVSIQVGASPATFCIAEAGGVDSNTDGCVRTGTTLTVGGAALAALAASSQVVIKFRVTIQ